MKNPTVPLNNRMTSDINKLLPTKNPFILNPPYPALVFTYHTQGIHLEKDSKYIGIFTCSKLLRTLQVYFVRCIKFSFDKS